jgi:hypothetical protein
VGKKTAREGKERRGRQGREESDGEKERRKFVHRMGRRTEKAIDKVERRRR